MDPLAMGRDPNLLVSDLVVDLPTETKIDIGMDLDVGADSILVAESVVDVLVGMEIEFGAKPIIVIANPIPIVDAIFDLMVGTDDMVYLVKFVVYLHYLN